MPRRRSLLPRLALALGVVGVLAATAACGSDDDGTSEKPVVIEISFEDGKVTPSGDRVKVDVDQPIDLEVTADEAGALHIHSDPEQTLDYPKGTKKFEIAVDRPGVVEVESHQLDVVIVQLEVR